jgi:arylsulfatase A-like enzyme
MEKAGRLDKTVIALVSDHSMGDVARHFPIDRFLLKRFGLETAPGRLWENTAFETRIKYYERYPAVLHGSGDRYWAIYLRRPVRREGQAAGYDPWLVRPTMEDLCAYPTRHGLTDLPMVLAERDEVDSVAYAAGTDTVRVRRKDGEVEFRQEGGPGAPISYRLVSGADPLGWQGKAPPEMLSGAPASPRAWLEATTQTDYPDLPAQILAYFRARRAGDIAMFAAPGWDFARSNRAGHGGLRPDDVHVPLLLAGPGIPHERRRIARTVDLMPTLLRLLGRVVPSGLDGESLVK